MTVPFYSPQLFNTLRICTESARYLLQRFRQFIGRKRTNHWLGRLDKWVGVPCTRVPRRIHAYICVLGLDSRSIWHWSSITEKFVVWSLLEACLEQNKYIFKKVILNQSHFQVKSKIYRIFVKKYLINFCGVPSIPENVCALGGITSPSHRNWK